MSNVKISNLTAATTPLAGTEVLPIVQSSTTKQVSVANLTAGRDVGTKNLTSTGDISFDGGTFVFNDSGADKDARFEGDTDPNLLFTDASTDRVGVGTSTPSEKFHASGNATFGVTSLIAPNRYTAFNTLNKATIAAAGTAVIDIVANNSSSTGFSVCVAEVDLAVAWAGSPQTLQGHYKYGWITVNNSTGGGTDTITEMYNGSAGSFIVASANFVVTRPSARTIRITYTSTALGDVSLSCLVKGWSISSVSIT
jgi:hypothetical protein